MQRNIFIDRFAVDQLHGGPYNLLASGRIEKRGIDTPVGYGLQAGFGYGIHPDNREQFSFGGIY